MCPPRTVPVATYKGRSHTGSEQLEQKVAVPLMNMEEAQGVPGFLVCACAYVCALVHVCVCVCKVGFCVAAFKLPK